MTHPQYTARETAADAVVHALGVGFALIGGPILIWLVAYQGHAGEIAAVSIYVATLAAMLSISAGYHLIRRQSWKEWLRRMDHSAIYLKIAGAYTPFAAISIGGMVGNMLLAFVWSAAAFGVALKILYPRRFDILSIFLYLALGWAAVVIAGDVVASVGGPTLVLLLIAGALYSLGVVFHLWESLPYQNAIWHVFVLAATSVLYAAVVVEFA